MSPSPPPEAPRAREATVLFADVLGYGELAQALGPDEAYAVVSRCLRLLDHAARRHGGAVDKYLGDRLMVVFGFPVQSPDAAGAALDAALEMRRSVREAVRDLRLPVPLAVKIGVNSGPIFAGDVGGSVIREFAVMGDAINAAARLKELAPPGRIWLGGATAAAARDGFELRDLGETRVKGKRRALRAWELVGARQGQAERPGARLQSFAPRVGREPELERLEARVAALRAGRGGVVLIEGEAGIGKSRLVAELARAHPEFEFAELDADGGQLASAAADAGPRAVVVEALERADTGALQALRGVVARSAASPLLLVLVARPDGAALRQPLLEYARSLGDRFLELALAPLGAETSERLIDAVAGAAGFSPERRRLVAARGAGNPAKLIQACFLAEAIEADAARAAALGERATEDERRRTTVLFADLSGFTALAESLDAAALHRVVSDCLERISGVARRWGGHVEKHLGDCVLATFGLPVALEEAPRAAVNAAIEMRTVVEDFNREQRLAAPLGIHIGVDTGLGVAGDVSGPLIREFTLMGESITGAAHLEDASPEGAIYVGRATWRATREVFAYERVALDDGGEAFELRSREPVAHRARVGAGGGVSSALVGRDAELAALREALAELVAGRGGVAALVGEAGLGKSRLVDEALRVAPPEALWLEGRSLPVGRGLAYHPFADLLARWCGAEAGDDRAAALGRLERTAADELGAEAEELVPFLATVMGLPVAERHRERLAQLGGEALERLIRDSVGRAVRRISARRPLVLAFEDLHWADLSSIELLLSLLHLTGSERLLFLFACRPHFADTSERVLGAGRARLGERQREIELGPLPADAARELLRNLFRGAEVPFAVHEAIEERAQGNPFYVEEVVRALLDAGALEERGGLLEATEKIRGIEIPGSLQDLIMARVDRLGRAAREALRVASAIGTSFHLPVLAAVLGDEGLRERVAALEAAEMLVPRERRAGEYRFKHPLIQEVVYDSLVASRREELHRAIGIAIEKVLGEDAPGYHAMLAWHFSRARDLERAEAYLFRAGDEAARAAASDEALQFFQESARIYRQLRGSATDPDRLALLERNIALALANRGRYVEAIAHFDDALRLHGVRVTQQPLLLGLGLVRDLAVVLLPLYVPGARRPRPPASERQRAVQELIYERARAQTTSAPARYLFDWMDGLRRLDSADPRSLPLAGGQFASTVGIFSYGGVSFGVSERFLRLAREIVDPADPTDRMIYGFMNALHRYLAGDWSDAHDLAADLIEERIRNGQLFDVANYLTFWIEKRIHQGRFDEANQGLQRLAEIAERFQYDLALSALHGETSFLLLEQERYGEAARAAEVHYSQHPDPLLNLLALGTRAKATLLGGDRDAAARSLEAAEHLLASTSGVVPPFQKSAVLRSRLLFEVDALARGDGVPRRARSAARRALRIADKVACRRAEVWRLEGTRRWLGGRRRAAERAWERAADHARRLGMAPELRRIEAERAARTACG